jgi:Lrp/AsnC family transcriptional regulator
MTAAPTLDSLDRRLLQAVQRQGDLSHAALAEAVGTSPASCWRRLKALEDAGVLGPAVRLLDPAALGLALDAVCQVRMKTHDAQARGSFEQFVMTRDEVLECLSMSGEWDYQLRIVVRDMAQYEHFLMHALLRHPAVATSASHFALKRIKATTQLPV